MLDMIGRKTRASSKPMGGLQVIYCGDFFQLPPVEAGGAKASTKFCFQSKVWKELNLAVIQLQTVYRQQDQSFIRLLHQIRWGNIKGMASVKSYPSL